MVAKKEHSLYSRDAFYCSCTLNALNVEEAEMATTATTFQRSLFLRRYRPRGFSDFCKARLRIRSSSIVVVSQLASPVFAESRPFQLIWPFAAIRVPLLSSRIDQSSSQTKDRTLLLKHPVDSVAFRQLSHPVKK